MSANEPKHGPQLPLTPSYSASNPLVITIASAPIGGHAAPIPGSTASSPLIIQVASAPSLGTVEPHWTAYMQAVSTPIVAVLAAIFATYFAWRQWRTAQNKLNFDLFQRRVVAYQQARRMVLSVAKNQDIFAEQLGSFDDAVQGSQWLFDKKVADELALLRSSALLQSGLSPVQSVDGPQPPKTFTGQFAKLQALDQNVEELDKLDVLFDPFMNLHSEGFWRSLFGRAKKSSDRDKITLASARYLDRMNPTYREDYEYDEA